MVRLVECTRIAIRSLTHTRSRIGRQSQFPLRIRTIMSASTSATVTSVDSSQPFVIQQEQGLARVGVLTTASGELATPNAFYYTKKGNPAHLTLDLLAKVPQVRGLQVPIAEFIQAPGEQAMKQYPNKIHDYVQLPNHILYVTVRDPLIDGLGSANENGVSLIGTQGTSRLTPTQYATLCAAYQPDIVASISDEISSVIASNRAKKSSQRSVMWVDEMQKVFAANATTGNANNKTLFFASIQGGADLEQRRISCYQLGLRADTAEKSGDASKRIDGFVLGGLGSGEDQEKRDEILRTVLHSLPPSKPRVLSSSSSFSGSPIEVVKAVESGVDLFEVQYPHQLTLLGQASVFQYKDFSSSPSSSSSALPITKLHLRDPQYAHDKSPILASCSCFTCQNHTRAYIHHLLNVHEMLAPILLDLHNLHHYSSFLAEIRSNISTGGFESYAKEFKHHFLPSSALLATSGPPQYLNQVGRALLGPFSEILAQSGPYNLRRILPKDNTQIAKIIRQVMTEFECTGAGYAIHDKEVDEMYQTYETHNLPPAPVNGTDEGSHPDAMTDVAPAASAVPAEPLPPLKSAYFVITRTNDDSVVLGGGGIAPLIGEADTAELRKMYFLPELRRNGLGQKLMDLCIAQAKQFGFKRLYLETTSQMQSARALYARNGFESLSAPLGNTGHGAACDMRFIKDL